MEGEGMVAVVRGLRDAGLAVTLLDGNRQYTLMPNSITQPTTSTTQRGHVSNANASTQPSPHKVTADSSTESSAPQMDNCAQAVDGRYASIYKTMYCNMRPTSPPIQLTEFPPQRPEVWPGQGNFQVGGTGSGATHCPIRASSPANFRGGLSWPDRGAVCSPRPSHEADAFANSLRKYPNLSPDRSSEVMERLINYTQNKSLSKSPPRSQNSPTRLTEPSSHHTLEPKPTTRVSRGYEPEVTIRSKRVEEPPTRDRKKDDHYDRMRAYDVRCIRDMSKRLRDNVRAMSSYPYCHPVCPTIKENHDYRPCTADHHNSSNSVNMEIQAAVKMISKEVGTMHRDLPEKNVALPSSAGEENIEGECYYVQCLDTTTSFKSIQTTFCPSDETLKPKKSAQGVCSSIDLKPKQRNRFIGRKIRSQEEIKVSKDKLRRSLVELIEEISSSKKSKKLIRNELIKTLFDTDRNDRDDNKSDRGKSKRERIDKYVTTFCPSGCDYVGDFNELVGKLKQSYGDTKQVMRTAVKPFRISEYKKLDLVLKDWINNLNVIIRDTNTQPDRAEILNTVEDKIKELFKNRTKQDFDLKSGIVKIIEDIPIEVNQSYNTKSYLYRLVDILLKRLKNVVILCQQTGRIRRKPPVNRLNKILTEVDLKDFVREHLINFFHECHTEISENEMDELENALIDVLIDSIDCIRCGHIDDAIVEMVIIFQDLAQLTDKQADCISHVILQNLNEWLNNCNFSQTYTILHSNVNSGQNSNNTTATDFSIAGITEADLNTNLDHYTTQLSQLINEWLDNLDIPQSQDRGLREVVVNDLAGDIVDRLKYMELNPNVRSSEEDDLEALKYQIFKWINKLVGEENTKTISNASELLQKVKNVPIPMLMNPQGRRMDNSGAVDLSKPCDPMWPCLADSGGNTCKSKIKNSLETNSIAPQYTQESAGLHSPATQTSQSRSGTYSNVLQDGQAPQGHYSQAPQGEQGFQGSYSNTAQGSQSPQRYYAQGSPGYPENYLQTTQGNPGQLRYYSQSSQGRPGLPGPYSQTVQDSPGQPGQYSQSTQGSPGQPGPYSQIVPGSPVQPGPYLQTAQGSPSQPGPYSQTAQGSPGQPGQYSQSAQGSPGQPRPYSHTTQGSPGQPGPYSQTPPGSPSQPGPYSQSAQGSPGQPRPYSQTAQGSPGQPGQYSQTPPGTPGQPGSYSQSAQGSPGQPRPYSQTAQGSPGQPGQYSQTPPGSPGHPGPYSQSAQGSPGQLRPYSQTAQGSPGQPGHYSQTPPGSPGQPGPYSQSAQGSPGQPRPYTQTAQGSPGQPGQYSQTPPGSPGQPGPYSQTAQGSPGQLGPYSQSTQGSRDQPGHYLQTAQDSPGQPGQYSQPGQPRPYSQAAQDSSGQPGQYSQTAQESPGQPGQYSQTAPGSPGQPVPYSQTAQGSPGQPGQYSQPGQPRPYSQTAQDSPGQPGQYSQTAPGSPGQPVPYSQTAQGSPGQLGPYSQTAQGSPGQPGPYSQTTEGSPGQPGYYPQSIQGSPGLPGPYSQSIQGSPGQPGHYLQTAQGSPGPPGPYLQTAQGSQVPHGTYGQVFPNVQGSPGQYIQNQSFGPAQTPYGQVISNVPGSQGVQSVQRSSIPFNQSFGPTQSPYGEASTNVLDNPDGQTGPISFGLSPGSISSPSQPQDPNHIWKRPPSSTIRHPAGNFIQIPMYETAGATPTSRRMNSPGPMSSPMYGPNQHATYGAGPGGVMVSPQGAPNTTFTGEMAPGQMRGKDNVSGDGMGSLTGTTATKLTPSCLNQTGSAPFYSSHKRLNDEYDEYLKHWVQKIPIQAKKPGEQQSAEKDRLGLYNGIWKAITKMKLDPEVFSNPYNYQDAFHEELDALLGSLPKSPELEANKHILKTELLEKTLAMNEMIRSTNAPASFKQQIIESIGNNLPRRTVKEQEIQQSEEVQKINLAEHYILYIRYKDEDGLKANVHKKNFLKKLEAFLDTIRKNYNADMDTTANANEIINSLDRIPIPHINAFKEEADDILLGMEIENWISDIPKNVDNTLPLEKRRIREAIVKKVQELGLTMSFTDCSFSKLLKQELPKYIEKIPIIPGTNIDFVIEELANRLKNISKDMRQKTVSFQKSQDYQTFGRNIPASSSFMEHSSDYGNSYNIVGGNVVKDGDPKGRVSFKMANPVEESLQWQSLQATQAPSGLVNWSQGQQSLQPQPYGQMPASGNYASDFSYSNAVPVQDQILGSSEAYGQVYSNVEGSPLAVGQMPSKGPCCTNPECINRPQGSCQGFPNIEGSPVSVGQISPSQVPQETYGQGFSNVRGSPLLYNQGQSFGQGSAAAGQVLPSIQESLGDKSVNAVSPQGFYGQGSPVSGPYGQVSPKVQGGSVPISQMHSQGPNATYTSQAPQVPYGQDFSNVRGSAGPYSQGQSFGPTQAPFGSMSQNVQDSSVTMKPGTPGPYGSYGQRFSNVQGIANLSDPYSQGQSFGPVPGPYGQVSPNVQGSSTPTGQMPYQGLNAGQISQESQENYGKAFPNAQGSPAYMGQVPISGVTNAQGSPQYMGQIPTSGVTNAQGSPAYPGQVPTSGVTNAQRSTAYMGQVPTFGGTNAQGGPVYMGQVPISGVTNAQGTPGYLGQVPTSAGTGYYGQEYQRGQASFLSEGDQVQQTKNQTAQSFGPVSAASQVPDSKGGQQRQNMQQMAGGGMGVLGTSQEPGSSTENPQSAQQSRTQKSEAQQPAAQVSDGFKQTTDQNENLEAPTTAGSTGSMGPSICKEQGPKKYKKKPLDINQTRIFNIKSVQTACSTIDIKTTKCKYCEIRSKSQEELTKISTTQEVIKRKDIGKGDIQKEATEWFEIQSDKVKVKLWGEKMQKLAEKLKKPGGEERLRMKIEKYLKKMPDQFSEGDDDKLEFRKQLPEDIIRKLKKININPTDANVSVYRMELFKHCSKFKMDNFKKVIMNWLKNLNIKKKDFLGRNVKKDDVFKYVTDKLEPLVIDRPKSDLEYKNVLKSNITDIIDDLPLVLASHNKQFYVNKVTETLVNDIFNIESNVPNTYIQPTIREIKEFVKDEITFFLEKAHVAISTKRMECLETELIDLLLDLTDIVDIDGYVMQDVTTILKNIGKLPEYKAKYFTNLLLNDYKEFFFRQSYFQEKNETDFVHPDVYSVFQNTTEVVDMNVGINVDVYTKTLVEEIFKWLSIINLPNKDKIFTEVVVQDLATDIVDRHKYLALNPITRGTDAEELEHLKHQIFIWMHKLVGEENTAVLEYVLQLMEMINNIPKPFVPKPSNNQSKAPQNVDIITFNEKLTDEISDWFHELPIHLRVSQDASLNKQLIKNLAEDIEKGLNKKDLGVIDKEVFEWTKKVLDNKKLDSDDVEQLKNRIRSISFIVENAGKDHKQAKFSIRFYEDIVDEWIDTILIQPEKEGPFINNRNEFIHDLAVKIYNIKTRFNESPDTVIEKKLQEVISDWMKKLQLHLQVDKQNNRHKYGAKLLKNIQACNINDSIEIRPKQTDEEFLANQFEGVILDWLIKLPLYQNKSSIDKENQETVMKELANKINGAIGDRNFDPDEDIIEHIKMLDPTQNHDFVQETALQLKSYLQKHNMFGDVSQHHEVKDDLLTANIEIWLNNLPLDVKDISRYENQKTDFIESMKRLRTSGSDSGVLKKEILTFMNTLPMDRSKRGDAKYFEEEASNLIQYLAEIPVEDISRKSPPKSNEIVSDAIKDWTRTLPLKPVYCPRELRAFIDDMSLVITSLLVYPEHSMTEDNDQKLHREIIKFLRRFPLKKEQNTVTHISCMAEKLAKTLKDIHLYTDDTKKLDANSITVYGVSLNTNTTDNDFSIGSIQETDINANLDTYTRQLVHQIGVWFDNLNLRNIQENGFKEVVINDLAGDIIDRHRYLELNPHSGGTKEEELEHLKYQIFKWINKLVGEENLETIENAGDLMKGIQKIPVPMLVRPQDKGHTSPLSSLQQEIYGQFASPEIMPVLQDNAIKKTTSEQVNALPEFGEPAGGGSLREPPTSPQQQQPPNSNKMSSSGASGITNNTKFGTRELPPPPPTQQQGTKEAIYDKYQKIFREKCDTIPIDKSTPENAKLAELAKTGIYNGIVKTFFKLKSDPDVENDYGYFEFMLEEKIEEMLDILPQTEELINKRHAWKLEILASAIDMLDELHTLTDRPSFRQRVRNKFNRNFARDLELEECFLLQQGFLAEMADAYILETKYKEGNPIKSTVYKRRLMKKVDDLANHLAKEHNVGFRFFKKSQLTRIAMKVLEQVPIPNDNILEEEAEEIQLADEVEKWYKELPTKPLINATDGVLRKRMMDLLAKKLYDIEKHVTDQDPSKEAQMKHEMSQFLEKRGKLQQDQDLNINAMVDDLNNRLKNRWLEQPADYNDFEKEKPLSSTFAQVDNNYFLAPLMDAATSTGPLQGRVYHEPIGQALLRDQKSILQSSCFGPSQDYVSQLGHPVQGMGQVQSPPRASPYGGNVVTSQMGPSQDYVSHLMQGSVQGRSPPSASPQADNLLMRSMGPGPSPPRSSPYGTGFGPSQVGPSEGYVSQQGPPTQDMAHVATSPRTMYGPQSSQVDPKASYDISQSQPRSNKPPGRSPENGSPYGSNIYASQVGSPQGYISQQGSPTALQNGQVAPSLRMQNMNQRFRQGLPTQAGPMSQELYSRNIPKVFEPQSQIEFSPNYPNQGLSPMDIPGYRGKHGPTPSQGEGTTAQVPGAPDEEMREDMEKDMKCRCLEAYRKRRRYFECEDRCTRFRPYKCYY